MRWLINRRGFLKSTLRSGLGLSGLTLLSSQRAAAVEPFKRPGAARLTLSLAAYSFRDYLNAKDPAKRITLFDFVDFCADHGCQGAELTSYYFPSPIEPEFLMKVKRH